MLLKALVDISIRKTPESYEWFDWEAGQVFESPAHMHVGKALARGIVEDATKRTAKSEEE